MSEEDIDIQEAVKTASFITISLLTPVIFLYVAAQADLVSFEFSIPLPFALFVMSVVTLFNIVFSISVLDQWRS